MLIMGVYSMQVASILLFQASARHRQASFSQRTRLNAVELRCG